MIDEYLKEKEEEFETIRTIANQHRVCEPMIKRLIEIWRARGLSKTAGYTVAFGGTSISCLCANLYLEEDDSMKGDLVQDILETVLNDEEYEFVEQNDYEELKWRAWTFRHKPSGSLGYPIGDVKIMVRFWYGASKSCRLVDSGKTKPIMEVICK